MGSHETKPKPWGRWATFGLGLFALLAGQAVALMILATWYGWNLARWIHLANDGAAVTLIICLSTPIQIVVLVLLAQWRGGNPAHYLALTLPNRQEIAWGIGAALLFIVASDGVSVLMGHSSVTTFQLAIYRSAAAAGSLAWLWFAVVVVAPIGEEILFRGFLFCGWHRSPGDIWAVIAATSVLWALLHAQYDLFALAQVFAYGLLLGWIRWRSSSIVLTMLLHSLANAEAMFETFSVVNFRHFL